MCAKEEVCLMKHSRGFNSKFSQKKISEMGEGMDPLSFQSPGNIFSKADTTIKSHICVPWMAHLSGLGQGG